MRRILFCLIVTLLVMTMFVGAIAEEIDIINLTLPELRELKVRIENRIEELEIAADEATGTDSEYTSLQKGDRNDAVKRLQERLIMLNYLDGKADGDYGNKTANAVTAFQRAAGLPQNGVADVKTQEALFADDAPAQKIYEKLNYDKIARDPDQYEGKAFQFSGNVLQVMEDNSYADTLGVYTVMRISSKGRYDDVVYVTYWRQKTASRILEDDKVTVYGVCGGLYTYTTTMGAAVTIPLIEADSIV